MWLVCDGIHQGMCVYAVFAVEGPCKLGRLLPALAKCGSMGAEGAKR